MGNSTLSSTPSATATHPAWGRLALAPLLSGLLSVLVSTVSAALLFGVLQRVARRPVRAFGMILTLELMHIVVAATVVGSLLRLPRPRRET